MKYMLVLALCMLVACASPEEVAARKARHVEKDSAVCQKSGYANGSTAFKDCMERIRLVRDQRKAEEAYPEAPPMSNNIYHYRY